MYDEITKQAQGTWLPTRKERPSLVQSSSSCYFIVVSGTIIIVVEPWHIICNEISARHWKAWIVTLHVRKKSSTTGGMRQLATIVGNVLPLPVGKLLRMWWPSSALMAAATISACNGSRVHAEEFVVLLIAWKSRRTSGKAGWVSRSCRYASRTFFLASNIRGLLWDPVHGWKRLWNIASLCGRARAITVGHFWSSWFLNQLRMGLANM